MRLFRSPNPAKKWRAVFADGKHTDFGSRGMDDYTILYRKDPAIAEEHRRRYRLRHKKDLNTNDPQRAGYLSYYLLWGDHSTVAENLKDYKKKFGLL